MTDPIITAAVAARLAAHAPYSRFLVGAALRCDDGSIHAGCNVENAAYPEGVCAEASAISAMVLAGGRRITAIAIAGAGPRPCTPCGGCRQKLSEFALPEAEILMVDEAATVLMRSALGELLPYAFNAAAFAARDSALDNS
ncbi:cytidine deaminase [Lichenicoccus sp.]|uniref:cytidine deaminase n=1 Tax=Lichenicoccus sp. TaxID=2781899 RepID=UPI003D1076C3